MKLIDIKNYIGNQMNTEDGATPNTVRDALINDALREFYSFRQWYFLEKTATITLTNGTGTLPTDFNYVFKPISVWYMDGTNKFELSKVNIDDLDKYTTAGENVYAIDPGNKQIKTKTEQTSLSMLYTYLPSDFSLTGSDDQDDLPAPTIEPVKNLALSMFWMSQERATGKQQLYYDLYTKSIQELVSKTRKLERSIPKTHPLSTKYVGFNA